MMKYILASLLIVMAGCQIHKGAKQTGSPLDQLDASKFISTSNEPSTQLYVLRNAKGMEAAITNYGGRIVGLIVPDKEGQPVDVVVGMESIAAYKQSTEPYFGALIGRVGNRIAKGQFKLNDQVYQLSLNNGPNSLHGGQQGFQYVVWDAEQVNDSTLKLSYLSVDGEENYPGNLKVEVVYQLTPKNGLEIHYLWTSDALTIANLTNHAFFNLNGEGSGSILNHLLTIKADYYTPVDHTLIPTGELIPVNETPFDFRNAVSIGARLDTMLNEQLKFGKGYDHNYVLNKTGDTVEWVARAEGDQTGIVMDIFTSEPGLQFYSGNFMQAKNTLKNGSNDAFRTAFCLETQHFPDSPNQPTFPNILVEPGRTYTSKTIYQFSLSKQN